MKRFVLLSFVAICSIVSSAQNVQPAAPVNSDTCRCAEVLAFAEEMPVFPGKENAFQKYISGNIQYPDSALQAKQGGTAYVAFTVDKTGNVCNVELKKGIKDAPALNEEALRVMRNSPDWKPGKMNGKPVCVTLTVPIKFVPGR